MDQELKHLVRNIVKITIITALPLTGLMFLVRDIPSGLSLFLGSFIAMVGFAANVFVTSRVVNGEGGLFISLLVNFLKIMITALVGAVLIWIRPELSIYYIAGFTLILVAIVIYTKRLK